MSLLPLRYRFLRHIHIAAKDTYESTTYVRYRPFKDYFSRHISDVHLGYNDKLHYKVVEPPSRVEEAMTYLREQFEIHCQEYYMTNLREYYIHDVQLRLAYGQAYLEFIRDFAEPYMPIAKPYFVNPFYEFCLMAFGTALYISRLQPSPYDLSISDVDLFCSKDLDPNQKLKWWGRIKFRFSRSFYKHGYYFKHIAYI
jgi:hypothetical protein